MYETDVKPEVDASPAIEGYEYESVVVAQLDSTFDDNFTASSLSIRLDDYMGSRLKTMRCASDYSVKNIVEKAQIN